MSNEPELNSPELEAIARKAAELPLLAPSRDLWSGIEARIQAQVVALPVHRDVAAPARLPWKRLAIAASLLVAVTAGVTYSIVKRAGSAGLAAVDSSGVTAPVGVLKTREDFAGSSAMFTDGTVWK